MGADNESQLQETVCENGKGGTCRKRTAKRGVVGGGRPKVSNCLFLTRRALGNSVNRSKKFNLDEEEQEILVDFEANHAGKPQITEERKKELATKLKAKMVLGRALC